MGVLLTLYINSNHKGRYEQHKMSRYRLMCFLNDISHEYIEKKSPTKNKKNYESFWNNLPMFHIIFIKNLIIHLNYHRKKHLILKNILIYGK